MSRYKALVLHPGYIQTHDNVHQMKIKMKLIVRGFIFVILGMDHLSNHRHLMTGRCLKAVCWDSTYQRLKHHWRPATEGLDAADSGTPSEAV